FQIVKATVPQMELYRYSSVLRSLTGGRGIHTEEFSHYEEMPRELEQKVIEEAKKRRHAPAEEGNAGFAARLSLRPHSLRSSHSRAGGIRQSHRAGHTRLRREACRLRRTLPGRDGQ